MEIARGARWGSESPSSRRIGGGNVRGGGGCFFFIVFGSIRMSKMEFVVGFKSKRTSSGEIES